MSDKYTVELDLTFLRHLVDCIEKQRDIPTLTEQLQKTWILQIKTTVKQCNQIIKDKEQEIHELELSEEEVIYDEEDFHYSLTIAEDD